MIRCVPLLMVLLAAACSRGEAPAISETSCGIPASSIGQFVSMPGGSFTKGASPVYSEEAPTLALHVAPFALQAHEVTNDQFAAFVSATGYVTDAENSAAAGGPGAGSAVFDLPEGSAARIDPWRLVPGATWKTPTGPGSDGFAGAAPVGCFPRDKAGLYDMIGNVWEWTDTPYAAGSHTLKGGSYLCADNFCRRYRPAARQPQDTDFSSIHIGFRIAKDVAPASE